MKRVRNILLLFLLPLFALGQTDSVRGKFHYVVCAESKPHAEQGRILKNSVEIQIDTTLNFLFGKIVDFKNQPIPFATVRLRGDRVMLSCQTDLNGKYSFGNLNGGKYSMTVLHFGYFAFTVDSILLTTGDEHELNIDLGEYTCLKTKTISTNVPMEEGDYEPQPIEKKEK